MMPTSNPLAMVVVPDVARVLEIGNRWYLSAD